MRLSLHPAVVVTVAWGLSPVLAVLNPLNVGVTVMTASTWVFTGALIAVNLWRPGRAIRGILLGTLLSGVVAIGALSLPYYTPSLATNLGMGGLVQTYRQWMPRDSMSELQKGLAQAQAGHPPRNTDGYLVPKRSQSAIDGTALRYGLTQDREAAIQAWNDLGSLPNPAPLADESVRNVVYRVDGFFYGRIALVSSLLNFAGLAWRRRRTNLGLREVPA